MALGTSSGSPHRRNPERLRAAVKRQLARICSFQTQSLGARRAVGHRQGSPWEAPQGSLGPAPHPCPPIPGQPGHRHAVVAPSMLCPHSAPCRGQTPFNTPWHQGVWAGTGGTEPWAAGLWLCRAGAPSLLSGLSPCTHPLPEQLSAGCGGRRRVSGGAPRSTQTPTRGAAHGPGALEGRLVQLRRPHQRRVVRGGSPGRSESYSWCRR